MTEELWVGVPGGLLGCGGQDVGVCELEKPRRGGEESPGSTVKLP